MRFRPPARVLCAACALALAGCGSGTLSRSSLAARADAICTHAADAIQNLGTAPDNPETNPAAATSYVNSVVAISDRAVKQLAALRPDSAARGAWENFVTANETAQDELNSARVKAEQHDPSGLSDLENAINGPQQSLDQAAQAIGASACAD